MLFGKKKRSIVRLLLVEDEPLTAFETEHTLTEEDYAIVATVDRVAQAVTLIEDGTAIDLVLVDVQLADGSGVDVARAACARGIPVLFVAGQLPDEAAACATGFLAKPFNERDLLDAIEAIEARAGGKKAKRMPQGFRLFEQV